MKISPIICLIIAFLQTPAFGQQDAATLTPEEFAAEFVINNSVYTLYHEIGHMLIGELSIPVLAKEEDAADNLATLLMLSAETVEADNALIDAVDSYFLYEQENVGNPIEDAELYDVHSLDAQRAFQIACLAVGADPEIFTNLAQNSGLDEDKQESCAFDFQQASDSWNLVLAPHLSLETPTADIKVTYGPTVAYEDFAARLKSAEVLEVSAALLSDYALPRPVHLQTLECGEANAFYDPEIGEINLCYELAETYYNQAIQP